MGKKAENEESMYVKETLRFDEQMSKDSLVQ